VRHIRRRETGIVEPAVILPRDDAEADPVEWAEGLMLLKPFILTVSVPLALLSKRLRRKEQKAKEFVQLWVVM
jgi:hypothetical protein